MATTPLLITNPLFNQQGQDQPAQTAYDPVALADYIEKKRKLGKVPLFTDDAKLAKQEGGFFINTGSARALAQEGQAKADVKLGGKFELASTGIPLVDKARKLRFEVDQAKATLEGDLKARIQALPSVQARDKVNKRVSLFHSYGLFNDAPKMQEAITSLQVADALANADIKALKAKPDFAARATELELASKALAPMEVDAKLALEQHARVGQAVALQDASVTRSAAISQRVALMEGLPSGDPAAVARAINDGSVSPASLKVAQDMDNGLDSSALTYYYEGQAEAGRAAAKYQTGLDSSGELAVAASGLEQAYKKAELEVARQVVEDKDEAAAYQQAIAPFAVDPKKRAVAAAEYVAAKTRVAFNAKVPALRQQLLVENTELLKPETSWSKAEADLGNQLVELIKTSSAPDLAGKLAFATKSVLGEAGIDAPTLSKVTDRIKLTYVRRFNERFGKLGLIANPSDLVGFELGILQRIFNMPPSDPIAAATAIGR